MQILYFAWLREKAGVAEEAVEPPAEVATVAELIEWLKGRSPGHAEALADTSAVRVALDQEYVPFDTAIAGAREVALFPPVTGG
ncbi:MAG: molybdopterin converting factor subunit 1 [Alphaproteobacteria bacterium]|jgi:molybdopterin synthase sulfur carrier subunit|nr:molybdopterin converting factor subunit 1 [Alphaproteobacteria bacterium]